MLTIKSLTEEIATPIIIVDHLGVVTHINEAFENTFGWKKDDLVGNLLTAIIPRELKDSHNLGVSRFLLSEKSTLFNQPLELKILRKDGVETEAEHTFVAEKQDGLWVFGARILPMSQDKSKLQP